MGLQFRELPGVGMSSFSGGLSIVIHLMELLLIMLFLSSNSLVSRSCVKKMSPFARLNQSMPRNVNDVSMVRMRSEPPTVM